MPSFFLTADSKRAKKTTKKGDSSHKAVALKRLKKNAGIEEETPRDRRKRKLAEENVASDDEYSGSDDHISEGSDGEYEDTHEKNYRQAKELLQSLKTDGADDDEVAEKLKEEVQIKMGTLHRDLASRLEIDDSDEISHHAHRFTPLAVALSPCKKYVVSTGKESHIIKYSIEDRKVVGIIKRIKSVDADAQEAHHGHIFAIGISPNGKYIVSGGHDCIVKVWDFNTLKHIRNLTGHRQPITCIRFRAKSTRMFTSSRDRTVRLWDLEQLGLVDTMFGHQDAVLSMDSLNKERVVTCGGQDRTLRLWKVEDESQLVFNGGSVCLSQDCVAMLNEDHFVSGSADGSISVWSVFKRKPTVVRRLAHGVREENKSDPHWVVSIAAAPFTDLVASGSDDGQLRIWKVSVDYKTLSLIYEYEMWGFINDLRFADDASMLVCAVGQEHKYGRWWVDKEAKNQIVVLPLKYSGEEEKFTRKVIEN